MGWKKKSKDADARTPSGNHPAKLFVLDSGNRSNEALLGLRKPVCQPCSTTRIPIVVVVAARAGTLSGSVCSSSVASTGVASTTGRTIEAGVVAATTSVITTTTVAVIARGRVVVSAAIVAVAVGPVVATVVVPAASVAAAAAAAATTVVATVIAAIIAASVVVPSAATTAAVAAEVASSAAAVLCVMSVCKRGGLEVGFVTSLWWAKVFAGGWGPGSGAAGLLDAQGTTFVDLALEAVLGGVGLLRSDHLDETKATRLTGVRVTHDAAGLDVTVLLEETANLVLGQARVDASNEEVRAGVDGFFFVLVVAGL